METLISRELGRKTKAEPTSATATGRRMTGFPLLIGAPSRFPRTELARLTPKSDLEKYRRAANLPVEGRKLASVETTEDAVLPALQEAGATGLQPAKDTASKFGADERALGGSSAPVPCEADAVARRPVILPVDPSPE